MAGDWIKMRVNLVTHPKVIALSEQLGYSSEYQDWSGMHGFVPSLGGTKQYFDNGVIQALRVIRYVVVTALLRFWGYANEHAKDDFIKSLRISDIDEIVGVPGFGCALESVEWAEYDEELRGTRVPNFSEYNTSGHERSAEAKTAAQRQKEYRDRKKAEEQSDSVAKNSYVTRDEKSDVTSNRREEKRREEVNTVTPNGFTEFWYAYPKKVAKGDAEKAWKKHRPDLAGCLAAIAAAKQSTDWIKDGGQYIPNPSTWLNGKRWEDGLSCSVGDGKPALPDFMKGAL